MGGARVCRYALVTTCSPRDWYFTPTQRNYLYVITHVWAPFCIGHQTGTCMKIMRAWARFFFPTLLLAQVPQVSKKIRLITFCFSLESFGELLGSLVSSLLRACKRSKFTRKIQMLLTPWSCAIFKKILYSWFCWQMQLKDPNHRFFTSVTAY